MIWGNLAKAKREAVTRRHIYFELASKNGVYISEAHSTSNKTSGPRLGLNCCENAVIIGE